MDKRELKPGDVVQLAPSDDHAFGGCFMLITEPKSWGAQGFIALPTERGRIPSSAFFRCKFEAMEYIGAAVFVPDNLEGH